MTRRAGLTGELLDLMADGSWHDVPTLARRMGLTSSDLGSRMAALAGAGRLERWVLKESAKGRVLRAVYRVVERSADGEPAQEVVREPELRSQADLLEWLASGRPGEWRRYHIGDLASDLPGAKRPRFMRELGELARPTDGQPAVALVQRRLGPGRSVYLAVLLRRPGAAAREAA